MRVTLLLALLLAFGCDDDAEPETNTETRDALLADDAGANIEIDAGVDATAPDFDAAPQLDVGLEPDVTVDAAPVDTWVGFAMAFMATYCVECHGEGDARDYTAYEDVERDAARIRCGTAATRPDGCIGFPPPGQFPVGDGPKPTDAERDRLVAWIEAELPRD